MSVILSYSAGSRSTDPYGFRVIDPAASLAQASGLLNAFPHLLDSLGTPENVLLINAYPATLGGVAQYRSVDTYMHPPTMLRAMQLAAIESKSVLFSAQPLLGADMLLRASRQCRHFPNRVLWATGGYPLPLSLERAVRTWLAERSCDLQVLHAYGIAELDHTLMAAMQRDHEGRLIYHPVHPRLHWETDKNRSDKVATLKMDRREVICDDEITCVDATFRIHGDPERFSAEVTDVLESWTTSIWAERTGYVAWQRGRLCAQRRDMALAPPAEQEAEWSLRIDAARSRFEEARTVRPMPFHAFAARFAMTWHQKPAWKLATTQRFEARNVVRTLRAVAA